MRWLLTINSNKEVIYKRAIRLCKSTKLKIKDKYTYEGELLDNVKVLYNEDETEEILKLFWKMLDLVEENYTEIEYDDLIKDIDKTIYEAKEFTLKEQMKNALAKEMIVDKLSREKRVEIIITKLEAMIDSSLDNMDQHRFKIYSDRRNKLLSVMDYDIQ